MCWWIGDGPRNAGRVEVGEDGVAFTATSPESRTDHVSFHDLRRVLLDSGVLRLERRDAPSLRIGSLDSPGVLRELAEHLAPLVEPA